MASDFEHGLAASVVGKPGLPLGSPPRYRREGDFIIDRFAKLIAAEGGDLRHIVRVAVQPDHRQDGDQRQRNDERAPAGPAARDFRSDRDDDAGEGRLGNQVQQG